MLQKLLHYPDEVHSGRALGGGGMPFCRSQNLCHFLLLGGMHISNKKSDSMDFKSNPLRIEKAKKNDTLII